MENNYCSVTMSTSIRGNYPTNVLTFVRLIIMLVIVFDPWEEEGIWHAYMFFQNKAKTDI
jgi:hypothetical protein